jgi:hypothetical protein
VPQLVYTKVTGEADTCDRPQKIRIELFLSSMLHYEEARSSSRPCVDCKEVKINEKNKFRHSSAFHPRMGNVF